MPSISWAHTSRVDDKGVAVCDLPKDAVNIKPPWTNPRLDLRGQRPADCGRLSGVGLVRWTDLLGVSVEFAPLKRGSEASNLCDPCGKVSRVSVW